MSAKRPASSDLNHDNWDKDDPEDQQEMGQFTPAANDIIEKRVIRTAKRRGQISTDETKKSVNSAFSWAFKGSSKPPPTSFDFLANLTNGGKPTNDSPSSKTDTAASTSVFNTNPVTSGATGGLFSIPVSSTSTTTSAFVMPSSQSSSLFGGASQSPSSLFTASKADTITGSLAFKPQSTATSPDNTEKTEPSSVVSSMFGIPPNNTETKKSLFSTAVTSSPFKIQPSTNTIPSPTTTPITESKSTDEKPEENEKKIKYYTKLKGLNESVTEWIKKHVEKTPLCILTPIFKDYENYLKDIQDEFHGQNSDEIKKHSNDKVEKEPKSEPTPVKTSPFGNANSLFSNSSLLKANMSSPFSTQVNPNSFGDNIAANASNNSSAPSTPKTSAFTFANNSSPSTLAANPTPAPFSFGTGKPFSISNFNAPKPSEAEEESDEPPKVEVKIVEEKDSIYHKKCKVFVKKDNNFSERGVGNLYIKKIEESGKHQLLVRANTNLGNIMLNLILSRGIPIQKMGRNNLMMICVPTPEAKPPPTSVLIRVKSSDEADELLETLNKYKS